MIKPIPIAICLILAGVTDCSAASVDASSNGTAYVCFGTALSTYLKEDTSSIKRRPEYQRLKTHFYVRRVSSLRRNGERRVTLSLKPKSPSTLDLVVWSSTKSDDLKQSDLDWDEFFNAYSQVCSAVKAHGWLTTWKMQDRTKRSLRWVAHTGEATVTRRVQMESIRDCWESCRMQGQPEQRVVLNISKHRVPDPGDDVPVPGGDGSAFAYLGSNEPRMMLWPQSWFLFEYTDFKKVIELMQKRTTMKADVAVVSPNGDRTITQWSDDAKTQRER